jgi:hypothetical protein
MSAGDDKKDESVSGHILSCAVCGRRDLGEAEHWTAILESDDRVALLCPTCAAERRRS